MKKNIPNIITSLNLLLGWTSIYFAYLGEIDLAIVAILLASVFDYFDGFATIKSFIKTKKKTKI